MLLKKAFSRTRATLGYPARRFAAGLFACGWSAIALPLAAQPTGTPTPPLVAATLAAALPTVSLTPQQIDHVAALGQVWGFLKYFHPAVAAGQRDWDAEFLRQLPAVLACHSVAERSRLLSTWVMSLGPVPACAACATPPTQPVRFTADLSWAQDQRRFSASLRRQLTFIAANRYQGPPYYATRTGSSTVFGHEEAYAEPACPAQSLRLLGLCRYWNMLQYYYPYKYLLGDWARVLPELLPRFANAATPLSYRHAAQALFARVHDGHARYFPPDPLLEAERGAYQLAVSLQFLDGQAVVTTVRHDGQVPVSPLQPGDVLTHLAGRAVTDLVRQHLSETSGSNRAAQLHTIALNLPYCATPQLDVQVVRAGQPLRLVVPAVAVGTVPAAQPAVADSLYRLLTPEVGYIDMARITRAKLPAIMRAFAHTKGIVVDQRNYPGEFVATQLPAYMLAQPVVFAKSTRYDLAYPGRFLWQRPDTLLPQKAAVLPPYPGRVIVLVNEVSRSLAEYTAMALRATPHGLLLGSQTAGADGNSTPIVLPGGLKTLMTGIGIYYPDGHETQQVGLVPDVVLRPTIAGLRQGRDELRERAVELILQAPTN